MTKWMLRIASLAILTVTGLLAQDITGTWQGKLMVPQAPNGELRIVFKILKADEGALKATFYMVDRPIAGLPASAVAIQGSNVTITIPGIGGTYEGKLDADAITLTGKWTAVGMPMSLTLAHVKDDAAWEIPKPPPAPKMMAADADPVFEVATIKPSAPNRRRQFSIGSGSEVSAVGDGKRPDRLWPKNPNALRT